MDNNVDMNHLLTLENREHLTLTGISDVDSFNEEEIIAISPCGELTIRANFCILRSLIWRRELSASAERLLRFFTAKSFPPPHF